MRSIITFLALITFTLLLIVPAMAQTEDELVNRFMNKANKNQIKKVGYVIFHGSYGKLSDDNDYNKYASHVNPYITTATGDPARISGIYRTKEFYLGFGMVTSKKTTAEIGFSYWLKLGTNERGDYDLTSLNLGETELSNDFDLQSQIQVYGLSSQFNYYLFNSPDKYGILKNFALKLGGGGGIYFAKWNLWNGFTGYNLATSELSVIEGSMSGISPGLVASAAAEYPIPVGGLIIEGSVKYLYLNFGKMKWYNDSNEENIVTYSSNDDRVELNLSGPRAQFGIKRYFSW